MGMPHIDFKRRKEIQTEKAIAFAGQVLCASVLLEIFYPSPMGTTPPSYYRIIRGTALPISRRETTEARAFVDLFLTYMPNGETVFQWIR